MQKLGFEFEASTNKGYKLTKTPSTLNAPLLQAHMQIEGLKNVSMSFHDSIDSTNTYAKQILALGTKTPHFIIAKTQTSGRGRLGRAWFSSDPGSIYASFIFKPNLPPQRILPITSWIGLSICEYLNDTLKAPIQLKWPNDFIFEGKKLGGILTEAQIDNDLTRDLIIGLSLNINRNPKIWPKEIKSSTLGLSEIVNKPLDLPSVTVNILKTVLNAYHVFVRNDSLGIPKLWAKYDYLKNQFIKISSAGTLCEGLAQGIDDSGQLILKTISGKILKIHSGDVIPQKNPTTTQGVYKA